MAIIIGIRIIVQMSDVLQTAGVSLQAPETRPVWSANAALKIRYYTHNGNAGISMSVLLVGLIGSGPTAE